MSKILFVANIHQHFHACHIPYIKWLSENGHEVHIAAGGKELVPQAHKQYFLSICRSPFKWQNIKAYNELKKLIAANHYDLVHCHTPVGGLLARLAARSFRNKTSLKVFYTAHGFYFFKGAPLHYWLLYFPVEKLLSRFTDVLITINKEDYENAIRFKFKSRKIFQINSIGINKHKFIPLSIEERHRIRKEYGFNDSDFLMIYSAEFIHRKNHRFLIDALPKIVSHIPEMKLILAGQGKIMNKIKEYASKKGMLNYIWFAGFRNDINRLMGMSDIGISTSKLEGLPMNIVEEMFCGLPVVVSNIRGHTDLVNHGKNGYLFNLNNHQAFISYIIDLYAQSAKRQQFGLNGMKSADKFSLENVMQSMKNIYLRYL